jgi:cytochrome c oxidase assembly factor CtaG
MFEGIDTLDTIQVILVVLLSVLVANYIYMRWSLRVNREADLKGLEGFANPEGPDGDTIVLGNDHLYDEFYAKIYDQIVDGDVRQDAETGLTIAWAKGFRPELNTIQVLNAFVKQELEKLLDWIHPMR